MKTNSITSIIKERIKRILAEIVLLEQEIKDIHKVSHELIYGREDILEPLEGEDYTSFIKLNKDYEVKKEKLDRLKVICKNLKKVKKTEGLKQEALEKNTQDYLTKQERTVLTFFNSSFPGSVRTRDIRTGLNLSKGCVYAHLRSFLITGLVEHNTTKRGADYYLLTCKGKSYLEKSLRLMQTKENFGI